MCTTGPKATDPEPRDDEPRRRGHRHIGGTLALVLLACGGGSGEGRGPWGGKPTDAKLRRQVGGYATDKERRQHDKGYGPRATPRQAKRYWQGLFARLGKAAS